MAISRRNGIISFAAIALLLVSACAPLSKGLDLLKKDTPNNSEIDPDLEITQEPALPGSIDQVEDDFPRTPDPISVQVTLDAANMVSKSSYDFQFLIETKTAEGSEFSMFIDNKLYTTDADGNLETAFGTDVTMTPISDIEGLPFSQGFLAAVQLGPEGVLMAMPTNLTITVPGNHETDYIGFASDGSGGNFHLYPATSSYADYNDTTNFTFGISHFSIYGVAKVVVGEIEAQQAHAPVSPASQDEDDLAPLITIKLPYDEMAPLLSKQQLQLAKSHTRLVKPLIDKLANTKCEQVSTTAYIFGEWRSKVDRFYYHNEYFQLQIDSDAKALNARFTECARELCPVCMGGQPEGKPDLAKINSVIVLATFAESLSFTTGLDDFGWWRQLSSECAKRGGIKSPSGSTGGESSGEGPAPTPTPFTCPL
ncbi:MAG: hypothetical protein C0401_12875 [Anaerolinea sp.]|nr:hypothetical protein [Anaerolinea sp.]